MARNGYEAVVQLLFEWNGVGPEFNEALRYATEGKHETVRLLHKYQEQSNRISQLLNGQLRRSLFIQ